MTFYRERAERLKLVTCPEHCEASITSMRRVHHLAECDVCGKPYHMHPYCRGSYVESGDYYFLHVGCNGLHAKL